MKDLLAAEFSRLLKSQIFYGALIFFIEFSVCEVLVMHYDEKILNMDSFLYVDFVIFGIVSAAFISLFVGTEYSDGTLRHKLISGHSRPLIYLSSLIICFIAEIFMQLAYFLSLSVISTVLHITEHRKGTAFKSYPLEIMHKQLFGFYIIAAYIAIFFLISILICSKSHAAVISMAVAVVMFVLGISISQSISSGGQLFSFAPIDILQTQTAEIGEDASKKGMNPYLFLNDFLPSCQAFNMNRTPDPMDMSDPVNMPKSFLYDCGIVIVTTACGMVIFSRKDLK